MPFDPFFQKALLDWITGAATPTQPTSRWFTLATASPTSQSSFEGPFSNASNGRASASMAAANSPQMSCTIRAVASWTATAIGTVVGWNLYNSSSGGQRIAYGTFSSSVGCASGDTFGIPVGALKLVMA